MCPQDGLLRLRRLECVDIDCREWMGACLAARDLTLRSTLYSKLGAAKVEKAPARAYRLSRLICEVQKPLFPLVSRCWHDLVVDDEGHYSFAL
jgi:hypothetical protein